LESATIRITSFTSFIEQRTFDKYLQEADFLILPAQRFMRFNFFMEQNSKTCVSGNINDMVRYGIPSLLPTYYKLDGSIDGITERYGSQEDLEGLLLSWINEAKYSDLRTHVNQSLNEEGAEANGEHLLKLLSN